MLGRVKQIKNHRVSIVCLHPELAIEVCCPAEINNILKRT